MLVQGVYNNPNTGNAEAVNLKCDSEGRLIVAGEVGTGGSTTTSTPPSAPIIDAPVNNATDVGDAPTIQLSGYSSPSNAAFDSATYQIASDSAFSTVIYSTTVNSQTHQVPSGTLTASTTYYLRARFTDVNGVSSDWSSTTTFTTAASFAQIIGLVQKATGGGAGTYVRIDGDFNEIADPGATWFNSHPTYAGIIDQTIDGQIMVRIPKFWFKAGTVPSGKPNAGKAYWMISDQPVAGFNLYPAFIGVNGIEIDQIWVGKYQASLDANNKLQSVPGVLPQTNDTLSTFRQYAYNRNTAGVTGFRLWSIYDLGAIQILATIEKGGLDMQALIGAGRVNESSAANVDAADVATATWRGIVGLWGNVDQFVDGFKRNGGTWYRWQYNVPGSTNTNDFSTGYVNTNQQDIRSSGYPVTFNVTLLSDGLILPATVNGTQSNGSTGDYFFSNSNNGDSFMYNGGAWNMGMYSGLFAGDTRTNTSYSYSTIGCRLAKV